MAKERQQSDVQQSDHPEHSGGWQTRLKKILDVNNAMKASGRGSTSFRTREERTDRLFGFFRKLRKLNFGIKDPANLRPVHIEALVKEWTDSQLSPATIANYLSFLATFCEWIGKPGMVKSLHDYVPDYEKRRHAATKDKSFEGNCVDFWVVFDGVFAMDQYVAMQLLAVYAFGMRRREVVMFKPVVADAEYFIRLINGPKGGRHRQNHVDQEFKRAVLVALKNFVLAKKGVAKGHLGNPNKNLKQNLKRFDYVMKECGVTKTGKYGVTAHGLRSEFVIDELIRRNLVPTIRGGSGKVKISSATETHDAASDDSETATNQGAPKRAGKAVEELVTRGLIQAGLPEVEKAAACEKRALLSESGQVVETALQIPAGLETKILTDIVYLQISEETGHSRKSVVTAYSGPLRPPERPVAPNDDEDATSAAGKGDKAVCVALQG